MKAWKPKLFVRRHLSKKRDLGPIWMGLLPDGREISCGAIRGYGWERGEGAIVFTLEEALELYRRHLDKRTRN